MPKQKKITKKLRAIDLSKPYIKSGFNQAAVARKRGVTRQTIQEQVNRKPTVDRLQEFIDSKRLDRTLINVAKNGLNATYTPWTAIGKKPKLKPDHNIRYKFWNGLMTSKGKIKQNGKNIIAEKGSKLVFQDIKIEGRPIGDIVRDINSRLSSQFNK